MLSISSTRGGRDLGRSTPSASVLSRCQSWLSKPAATPWLVLVALVLNAPALGTGLMLDDNFHAVVFSDEPAQVGPSLAPWDGFAFAKDPESIQRMIDQGIFAWWSDLEARFSFFRPLTSLTIWLDHRLWPGTPALMHAHSLLWYGVLLYVIAHVYRRFSIAPAFAGLALAIYALDDARAMTVGWIANRGALLALVCGFAALLAHDSWRSTGRKRWLAAAVSALAVGLLCAEAAVQALGYLLAYALFLDQGPRKQRAWSLVPYAVLVVVWRAVYTAIGYGAARTERYIDPGSDPLRFIEAALGRMPVLLTAQFAGLTADLADTLKFVEPGLIKLILPLCLVCIGVLVWLFAPLWRSRREVRFWAMGTFLSTIPVCAVTVGDRLLAATALGGSALIACLLLAILDRAKPYRTRLAVYAGVALGVINLVIAPLLLPLQSYWLVYLGRYIASAEASVPSGPEIANKTLVMLNPPADDHGIYMPFHRQVHGGTMPEHIRWLATGDSDLRVTRVDPFSLEIKPSRGFLAPGSLWTLRSPKKRSFVGETLELTGVTYRVTEVTTDGRPAEVLVRFAAPLNSDEFIWLQWGNRGGYVPFSLPEPGTSVVVPAIDFESLLNTL
jgi:hypothetical protein